MMARSLFRTARVAGLAAAALLLTGGLAACGSETPASNGPAAPAAATEPGAFPATIDHKYGSTTITAAPQRVVTVGLTEQDALLAVGVMPVGVTNWIGEYPGAIGPWATGTVGTAALPEVLTDTDGPQFEKIAALKPDLILGLYSGLTQEAYDTLSKIAPTVAQPKAYSDYGIPWQEETRSVGKAVGKPAAADKVVTDVEARFEQARKENPKFAGATGLMVSPYEGYFVFGTQDARSRTLTSLGLKMPNDLDTIIGNTFGASISAERTDLLDRDALVWLVENTATAQRALADDKLYSGLKVAKEKREIFIEDASVYGQATSFVTALSLPFVLDRLVPQLSAALDGDPATEVKPAE
jgi:iron complex transport system substrate-binding protein